MNRQELETKKRELDIKSQDYINDIYIGFNGSLESRDIRLSLGVFKPGETRKVAVRYHGKMAKPTHVITSCNCTPNWEIKKRIDEDEGEYFLLITELTTDTLEKVMSRQEAKNGAKNIGYNFNLEVLFDITEELAFLKSDDGYAKHNPMNITARLTLMYTLQLD